MTQNPEKKAVILHVFGVQVTIIIIIIIITIIFIAINTVIIITIIISITITTQPTPGSCHFRDPRMSQPPGAAANLRLPTRTPGVWGLGLGV